MKKQKASVKLYLLVSIMFAFIIGIGVYGIAGMKKMKRKRGTCPWILVDFRSPTRMLPGLQDGWNRKGLLSDQGFRKKA